jgi:hypothetical protein
MTVSRRWMFAILLLSISVCQAADDGWIDFFGKRNLDLFRTIKQKSGEEYAFVNEVGIDSKNNKKLTFSSEGTILVNGPKGRCPNLYTKQLFKDVEVKVEFMMAKGSNAGLKFHGTYEIQMTDSFGKPIEKMKGEDCGGVYPRADTKGGYHHIDDGIAPKVNACKAPGEWQTLEATFLSPRFDAEGKKIENAKIVMAKLNGQVIHENLELKTPTGDNWNKPEKPEGPLMLQGDHGPTAFRNFLVKPITK